MVFCFTNEYFYAWENFKVVTHCFDCFADSQALFTCSLSDAFLLLFVAFPDPRNYLFFFFDKEKFAKVTFYGGSDLFELYKALISS